MSLLRCVSARVLAFGVLLGPCLGAGANDLAINLKVQSGGREQTAMSGQPAAPPVFTAKAKEVVWVQWSVANGATGTPLSDITLHVFMDRGDAAGGRAQARPQGTLRKRLDPGF